MCIKTIYNQEEELLKDLYDFSKPEQACGVIQRLLGAKMTPEGLYGTNTRTLAPGVSDEDEIFFMARRGDVEAIYCMGCICREGVHKDLKRSVKWFKEAAQKGYALALCALGFCYNRGQGVKVNKAKAIKLWLQTVSLEDSNDCATKSQTHRMAYRKACASLSLAYRRGDGVQKDISRADYYQQEHEMKLF
ncbi:MAG: hypothetical protein LBS60_10185 [Deltaproteobacteria bacterium]|jgi:TPR repeat protein|nr:hypothetical protein [Deltaproteobacteria bacterium]